MYLFGQHPAVCRFMKVVYEVRPALPKHQENWDVSTVLEFCRGINPKAFDTKTHYALALTSAQGVKRCKHYLLII